MLLEKIPVKPKYSPDLAFRIKFVWCFTATIISIVGGFVTLLTQDWRFMLVIGGLSCLVGLACTVMEILA